MNVKNERVLIFGDSLSHHGPSVAPEIWDVTAGSDRTSAAPGDLLASLLLEQGAQAVRIDANVGRSASNFWTAPNRFQARTAAQLLEADRSFRPTKVIVMLGTNDAAAGKMDAKAAARIRDAYLAMGADEVIAIGPPVFASPALTPHSENVYAALSSVFSTVVDMRPLSSTADRAADGIHFTAKSAKILASLLADSLRAQQPAPELARVNTRAIFGGLLLGVVFLAVLWARRPSRVARRTSADHGG